MRVRGPRREPDALAGFERGRNVVRITSDAGFLGYAGSVSSPASASSLKPPTL